MADKLEIGKIYNLSLAVNWNGITRVTKYELIGYATNELKIPYFNYIEEWNRIFYTLERSMQIDIKDTNILIFKPAGADIDAADMLVVPEIIVEKESVQIAETIITDIRVVTDGKVELNLLYTILRDNDVTFTVVK